ncbi:hypothetical protein [Nocardia rhamnosiphila]|uniref:hypothetical protein n=1 Tax=Nocardia rhamnosiphila TaxID=426716 RepID=UPI0012DD4C8B|nr:hypothetical protein [Nocardia rhamnosiphila]
MNGPRTRWFFQLCLDDQIAVLADPGRELPEPMTGKHEAPVEMATDSQPRRYRLTAPVAEELRARRDRLTRWWQTLTIEQRTVLIEHRDTWLPSSFRDIVPAAEGVLTEYHRDPVSGEIEPRVFVTAMTRVFLEAQARTLPEAADHRPGTAPAPDLGQCS